MEVEVDIRGHGDKLLLSHDPIVLGKQYCELDDYLSSFSHKIIIFNLKEAGEKKVIDLASEYKISNYFLLDVEFPYFYKATREIGFRKLAIRYSEAEPIEFVSAQRQEDGSPMCDWVWIDTNTTLPLDDNIINKINGFSSCLVCPERWGRPFDIENYIDVMRSLNFIPDAVMTSEKFAPLWEKLSRRLRFFFSF